jgi:hypothetical protein
LHKTCDSLASDNVVENSEWNLWKSRRKFYTILKIVFHKRFGQHFDKNEHTLQMTDSPIRSSS